MSSAWQHLQKKKKNRNREKLVIILMALVCYTLLYCVFFVTFSMQQMLIAPSAPFRHCMALVTALRRFNVALQVLRFHFVTA